MTFDFFQLASGLQQIGFLGQLLWKRQAGDGDFKRGALWLDGRLQSRTYLKTIGETTQERTAFEISITCLAFPEELPQETDLL